MNIEDVDLRRIKSTLVIMYCGRSGSYLLSNLMDGHSEVLSCPPHSVDQLIETIVKLIFEAKQNCVTLSPKNFIDEIVKKHFNLFKETDHTLLTEDFEEELRIATQFDDDSNESDYKKEFEITATSNSEIGVDKTKFCKIAKMLAALHQDKYEEFTIPDIFSLVHWSYALALGRKISTDKPTICWQRHTIVPLEILNLVAGCVINPIFVNTIRRFEDALDSHIAVMTPHFKCKDDMGRVLVNEFAYNLSSKNIAIPQWAIRFEDMHINTEALMRQLCLRLDINFERILLETTLDNQIYFFDNNGKSRTGTNKDLKRSLHFDNLSIPDIIFLNLLFCKHYKFYGYALHPATLEFVECDPSSLSSQDLLHFLTGIQQSGRSYLANLRTDCKLETNYQLTHMAKQEFKPLELISAESY